MQLVNPQRGTSFYESFSDLIFGTLIIFLVVILALMVRISGKQGELVEAAESEIAVNQYAGGAALTEWGFTFVIRQGKPAVAFVPQAVWSKISVQRFEQDNVVLELCGLFLDPQRGLTVLSIEEFQGLGEGFSRELAKGAVIQPEIGDMISRAFAVQEAEGGSLAGWSSARLVEAIGGMMAGSFRFEDRPSEAALSGSDAYFGFIAGPGEPLADGDPMQFFRQYEALRGPMAPPIEATADEPGWLRFSLTGDRGIQVGRTVLSAQQFRGILSSLSVGKRFYLEYAAPGDEPQAPPDWVLFEVLKPTGFDRRLPSEQAIDLLRDQR